MKKYIYVLFTIMWFPFVNAYSQSLNNRATFDSMDVSKVFNMIGVEIYKYYFEDSVCRVPINIITEEYTQGNLKDRSDSFVDLIKYFKDTLQSSQMLQKVFDSKDPFRCYVKKSPAGKVLVVFSTTYREVKYEFDVDSSLKNYQIGTRAMASPTLPTRASTFVLVVYIQDSKKQFLECPSSLPITDIVKMYDQVIAIYIDPF